jgi:hypothetical protein
MRLAQDIANILAVAIRDVIWYKDNVISFLKDCEVPKSIIIEAEKFKIDKKPTIIIIHHVLDRLYEYGDDGVKPLQNMMTKMYYWNDFHTIADDRKDKAIKTLREFQKVYKVYREQQSHLKKQEKLMQADRVKRTEIHKLDHKKLQHFRDEFDRIYAISDVQKRGNEFETLMNEIFDYYCEESQEGFHRTGEQIDGMFYFDKHWYYVEVRWRKEKANAADISILRSRAKDAYGGDTKALFISFEGFTTECLKSLVGIADERVILMDGADLRFVLDCQIAFDVLIARKQAFIVQKKEPFIPASEIIKSLSR